MELNSTNIIILAIIGVVIVFGIMSLTNLYIVFKIKKAIKSKDTLSELAKTKLAVLTNNYKASIIVKCDNGIKSNVPSSEYFNTINISKAYSINLKTLDAAGGTLVGLGLFGTFWGLADGIGGFEFDVDNPDSKALYSGIRNLLGGMSTAFDTSLWGMGSSLVFGLLDKLFRNCLLNATVALTERLDSLYFIDDISLQAQNQKIVIDSMYSNIKSLVEKQFEKVVSDLDEKLSYNNEGNKSYIGNAVREILTENKEQSRALKSFSTDLALELNNGFDEVLSRQMQEKILPLMENVDTTTKAIVQHIDKMADTVSSPATEMIQNVVGELKSSMKEIVDEFRTGLSTGATNELNGLAEQLGTAAQAMADFPNNMQNISATLQVTIDEVKTAISEISNTSANANSTAMQQMQEQITFATGAISNAISEVKDVMSGISKTSQEESNKMVGKLAEAAEKMGTFLSGTISSLSSSVQDSVKKIADDVASKQADLIALQEDTTTQTKKLLEQFNVGLERLEKMNGYIQGTMDMFQQAQNNITGSTAHLQTITGDMKTATQLFNKSQTDYSGKLEELQKNSQRGIDAVVELVRNSGQMSEDYVMKFEIIKQGLGSIFSQLQNGLTEYSRTVQSTTQKYLDQYSSSLTTTTDALSSAINEQSSVVEMLVESLNSHKR